ncbi:MAG: hypothetical protein Q9227_002370 [Pyrenula ochraceoflavens]
MSGIEIGGLALAVLPLVISAAEHNIASKLQTIASNKAKNDQQLSFYYELYEELALLASNLQRLINDVPSLRHHSGAISLIVEWPWHANGKIDDALKAALRANYEPFRSILERLLKSVEYIVSDKSLALTTSDTQSPNAMFAKLDTFKLAIENGETKKALCSRLQFTKNKRTRQVALLNISDGNKKLERLLQGSLLLRPQSDDGQLYLKKNGTPPTRTRKFSVHLYDKMAGKWPTSCDCPCEHQARLCLWNCCSTQHHPESDDSLDMVVSVANTDQDVTTWQESTVLVSSNQNGDQTAPRREVRFVVNNEDVPNQSSSSTPGKDIDAESLCSLITQSHRRGTNLRMVFERGKLWQTRSRRRSLLLEGQNDIPLKGLLRGPSRQLKLKDKWTLAVILAHAALHCSNSPWLCNDWSKEHITFFRKDSSGGPDLSRPYLTVNFTRRLSGAVGDTSLLDQQLSPALESLGILLLEIYLSEPIESRWSQEDLTKDGQPNEHTNLTTAFRLLQASEGDQPLGYRRAIEACLECDKSFASNIDLNSEKIREQVYDDIVYPLEQELEHGFGLRPEDL